MTVLLTAGCICGETTERDCPDLLASLAAQDEWARDHTGPGHGPCSAQEAQRIAKRTRARVKG